MTKVPTLWQKFLAEMIGTGFLVFVGAGAATATGVLLGKSALSMADLGVIGLAFAIAIAVMVYSVGHISGCHINPAVTIAMGVTRRMSWREAGVYLLAQFVGGLLGALAIALAYGASAAVTTHFGANDFSDITVGYPVAIAVEAIGTFFLLFVIMGTAVDGRAPSGWAGLMIGLTVGGEIMALGPVTGASLNPARSFGPAIIQALFGGSYNFAHLIPYFVGPILGGILGVLVYGFMAGIKGGEAATESKVEATAESD
ncbi:MAG TPA: MIP/aquaporin family protein [Ktedonobacteraceae bacterium]|nr:MIP/aquaporin family protein [Ktedonobacteraceae bacterium]